MPAQALLALEDLDLEETLFGIEDIRARNPQRHDLEMLDRIVHLDGEAGSIVAVRDIRDDEFWVRCHFPQEPILPGVLMIEAAGQLCSFYYTELTDFAGVIGFAACQQVKFRGIVRPGDRLVLAGQMLAMTKRRARFKAQGFVEGKSVFEAEVTGMAVL